MQGRRRSLNPVRVVQGLWHHRDLIRQMVNREISQRYRGTVLGFAWSLIVPLTSLAIYTFVFSGIFRSNWRPGIQNSTGDYALTLFAGLTAFNVLAETLSRAPNLVLASPNLVKKVVFPLEILPVVQLGATLATTAISLVALLVVNGVLTRTVSATLWLLPLTFVPLVLLALGISWFFASLGVYVRDLGQGVGLLTQVLLFLSPVMYPTTAIPEAFRVWFNLNPLTSILNDFRATLLWGQVLDWPLWMVWFVVSALVAWLGYAWFIKTKPGFADVM